MDTGALAERLGGWLSTEWHEPTRVASLSRFEGGVSNLTYRVCFASGQQDVVLRLQREQGIFQPYDVLREARVLRCLADGPVPVPRVLLEEREGSVLGAPFFLMSHVEGRHFGELAPQDVPSAFQQYLAAVVGIHEADWQTLGLGFLEPSSGSLVGADIEAIGIRARAFGCSKQPLVARLRDSLAVAPEELPPSLCQGDINVYNYIYRDGMLAAVVDWEQAGVGDRRLDLGLIACLSMLKMGATPDPGATPIISPYEAATGMKLRELAWFVTLAAYKLAVIHYGWKLHNGSEPWFSLGEIEDVADALAGRLQAR
jgi:aminoglycoside phosphotransferase (APT) family kinase protein